MKRLAVSLVALLATLALFATLSAAAQGVADTSPPIINPAIDDTARDARILICCNNNLSSAEGAFPSKLPSASLNLPTYVARYDYGYRNVYELGPLIDVEATATAFAGRAAPAR